ncbi:hypothetical protein Vadar_006541 [Vaccinium darrowii]|uniref:Uncharacterized protein n=1 Tax=Vaccinium darrowii TaxID=229202 RepID=A0ACB7XYQ4_9ERIC|nr:hypothetical protein Vadar_006541 [Vaccinium darrowii]
MAEIMTEKGKGKVQVFDFDEDLAVFLAEHIADLSIVFPKRGAFTICFFRRFSHHEKLICAIWLRSSTGNWAAVNECIVGFLFCRRGKYTEDEGKAVLIQILDVVSFCHLQGVVHRDLKPEVADGPDTEVLVASPAELSGWETRVFHDVTLALKTLGICIFSAETGGHSTVDSEWELYRFLLDGNCKFKLSNMVRNQIVDMIRRTSSFACLQLLSSLSVFGLLAGSYDQHFVCIVHSVWAPGWFLRSALRMFSALTMAMYNLLPSSEVCPKREACRKRKAPEKEVCSGNSGSQMSLL